MKTEAHTPAFPTMEHGFDRQGEPIVSTEPGMTLRQYYAGLAMQGLISSVDWNFNGTRLDDNFTKITAEWSVNQADALIKALNETEK